MKVLNRHGLPRALAITMAGNKHVRADVDYTATELFKPPLMLRLEAQHEAELSGDVVDGLKAFYGTAIHAALGAGVASDPTLEAEVKISASLGGWTIGGTPDLYDSTLKALYDYKFTSVFSTIFGEIDGAKKEWVGQLNCYAYVLKANGKQVDSAAVVALYSDWREAKARESQDYPQLPVGVIPVQLYEESQVAKALKARCKARDEAKDPLVPLANVPQCTAEERWEKPTKYAVYQKSKPDRAMRVLDSIEEATAYVSEKKLTGAEIKIREGESVRCKSYCLVRQWCPYYNHKG